MLFSQFNYEKTEVRNGRSAQGHKQRLFGVGMGIIFYFAFKIKEELRTTISWFPSRFIGCSFSVTFVDFVSSCRSLNDGGCQTYSLVISCSAMIINIILTRIYFTAEGTLLNVMWQAEWEGIWGKMDTCICMAESLCCLPGTITTLFVNWLYLNTKHKVLNNK